MDMQGTGSGEMVISQEEHSKRAVTIIFLFKALQTCKGPLKIPRGKVNSREESSLEECFQTTAWGAQGRDSQGP